MFTTLLAKCIRNALSVCLAPPGTSLHSPNALLVFGHHIVSYSVGPNQFFPDHPGYVGPVPYNLPEKRKFIRIIDYFTTEIRDVKKIIIGGLSFLT